MARRRPTSRSAPAGPVYRALARVHWRTATRSLRARQHKALLAVFVLMALYLTFTLVVTGAFLERFVILLDDPVTPLALVNGYLLPTLVSLFAVRFLFQRPPQLGVEALRHLPVPAPVVVRYAQAASLLSVHNLFPLLFVGPFWVRHLWGTAPPFGALAWLVGVLLLLAASTYATTWLRGVLARRAWLFLVLMGAFGLVWLVDERTGQHATRAVSTFLFEQLLNVEAAALTTLALLAAFFYAASAALMRRRLDGREGTAAAAPDGPPAPRLALLDRFGAVGALVQAEIRMVWRSRRPRHYLLVSLLFSTVYLLFLVLNPATFGGVLFGSLIGLFASGAFALNYGQLMFSWESSVFDGLLSRPLPARTYLLAKLLLLQGSCGVLYLVSLPLIVLFDPDLLGLHFAFLLYNAGVTCLVVMLLALRNRRPVALQQGGGFFNYEGFSAAHWLWFIPTVLPPTLLLFALRGAPRQGLLVLGALGLMSLAATPVWTTVLARAFHQRRLPMADGFRGHDG